MTDIILAKLIKVLKKLLKEAVTALAKEPDTVGEWVDTVTRLLARYSLAAYMAGAGTSKVTDAATEKIKEQVAAQVEWLQDFAKEVKESGGWKAGWDARAESYADSIQQPYWSGKTKMLPLPALPGQGTQCRGNCACKWRVVPIDPEQGDYDCYWQPSPTVEHCQTCKVRAARWNPLKIRGGELSDEITNDTV
jgi:hypothetical protein